MKRALFLIVAVLLTSDYVIAQVTKVIVIYNDAITHTNIKAYLTYEMDTIVKEDVYYSVTSAAMWTGKMNTQIVYKGNLSQMLEFFKEVLSFAEVNKDNIGAYATIDENIYISITKIFGVKCVTIKNGPEVVNTNYRSINEAVIALENWIKNNK